MIPFMSDFSESIRKFHRIGMNPHYPFNTLWTQGGKHSIDYRMVKMCDHIYHVPEAGWVKTSDIRIDILSAPTTYHSMICSL